MSLVISPSVVENEFAVPLTHARIGYDNFVPGATVTATSAEKDWPADSMQRENTFERWQPTSGNGSVTIDTGSEAGAANYLGIAAHTLGSSGSTVTLAYSADNSAYTTVESVEIANDRTVMILFAEAQARYWRVTVSGPTAPQIGVIYLGITLDMQRAMYVGHSPVTLSRTTTVRPTKSDQGQFLGRSAIRYGLSTNYEWDNLTAAWYRANFDPFVKFARFKPFFIAWRPSEYPDEVAYGYIPPGNDISPNNTGPRDLMSVSFSFEGYASE